VPDADPGALDASAWQVLTPARRLGALRRWLADRGVTHGIDGLAQRVVDELPGLATARWPVDNLRQLRLYRGRLSLVWLPAMPAGASPSKEAPAPVQAGRHALDAWGGVLELVPVEQGGVSPSLLASAGLRDRRAGDQFQFTARSSARSLKKQYQDRAVPAWERSGPIIAAGDRVVFVPGLGIDARVVAPAGELQFAIHWLPDD
jgi:tRNA(Ile)-lysidine synthase